jgi:hypothetical protein
MLPGLCNFRPVTPTRIGTVAFFICIAGTIASVPLLLLARAAAGKGGYAVMLIDPRYQWAGVMVTVSTVMEAVGFGAVTYLLRVFSRVGAWLAFVALLLASIIVAVANSMELWNSFLSQNNATVAYDSTVFSLMTLAIFPLQMVGFGIFGGLLLARRETLFGAACLLGVAETLFALYCMAGVDTNLQLNILWVEMTYKVGLCLVAFIWLRSQRTTSDGHRKV